ncbi:filament-like plant protein isoform X2 [Durio zibethinus]|uniref:Filament-like plant protein isoform X2 n=1 Tax=Durio zibethinus TaxID=66656 RepID=A0A6P5ZDI3_DURZI|nr:filament-like plant protein isoform X2 [Durio zibethinus]
MDRRSWLWRRKSAEQSPGETDSSGGSISSHSERFSGEQASATHGSQLQEVTSKAVPIDVEVNDNVRSLTEKLSAALMNISAKEDLVKQHAKVTEEAISGWEKAEKDVLALKQQLDAAIKKNAALEDRVGHLDGALKECVRQLRQAREEQERKIHEAVAKKCHELESSKSELESQLLDLKAQLQTTKSETAASVDPDLHLNLKAFEKENSALKLKLLSQAEELELRIIERDLSNQAAETVSKQHLDSIKKLAKLEAECRRLKAIARKASPANDQKSYAASSICVESFTDSQSDSGERLLAVENDMRKMNGLEMNEYETSRSDSWASALITELDQFRNEKAVGRNIMAPSVEFNLMDDFLEMERLAALPDTENGSGFNEAGPLSDQTSAVENPLKAELETFIQRIAELEEKLAMTEAEKLELQMAITETQKQLKTLQNQLREAETKLEDVQTKLALADNSKQAAEMEVKVANMNREVVESRLRDAEIEIKTLTSKVTSLEEEVEKEKALFAESMNKCKELEDELSKLKCEAKLRHEVELQHVASYNEELKVQQDKELAIAASKLAECQKTIASLGQQLKSLATLEDFLIDSDKPLEPVDGGLLFPRNGEEQLKLGSTDMDFSKRGSESSKIVAAVAKIGAGTTRNEARKLAGQGCCALG